MDSEETFVIVPPTRGDEEAWRTLWSDYCDFYQVQLPESVIRTTWERLMEPTSPVSGLLAKDAVGNLLGFAHYVLHLHTWSEKTLCYLEDLYVLPEARGRNIGHQLITHLVELGRENDWKRVYWHTDTNNVTARRLYDRFQLADDFVRYTINL